MTDLPDARPARLPGIDYSKVDRLLVSGQWVDILQGSLHELPGVVHQYRGEVFPLLGFTTPEGEPATVLAQAIQGFAPAFVEGED